MTMTDFSSINNPASYRFENISCYGCSSTESAELPEYKDFIFGEDDLRNQMKRLKYVSVMPQRRYKGQESLPGSVSRFPSGCGVVQEHRFGNCDL